MNDPDPEHEDEDDFEIEINELDNKEARKLELSVPIDDDDNVTQVSTAVKQHGSIIDEMFDDLIMKSVPPPSKDADPSTEPLGDEEFIELDDEDLVLIDDNDPHDDLDEDAFYAQFEKKNKKKQD